jgi:methyl-accepting chemotaxis protein
VTQQNAANAEESSAASEELSTQAVQMKTMVEELLQMIGGQAAKAPQPAVEKPRARVKEKARIAQTTAGAQGSKAKVRKPPALKANMPAPEQVIPLESEDFKDF